MKRGFVLAWLVSFVLMAGCTSHLNVPVVEVSVSPPVVEKIPLRVAVVLPDENYVMNKTEGIVTETVPAGKLIGGLSRKIFPYLFQDVKFITGWSSPVGIDAVFTPSLEEFRFIQEQVALGFGLRYTADVSLRGILADEKGKPLWEQVATASRTSRSVVSPVIPLEQLEGESLSEALAEAFKKLGQEMVHSRDIRAYADLKGMPDTAPPVHRANVSTPSKKPAPVLPTLAKRTLPRPETVSRSDKLPPLRPETHAVVIGIDYKERKDIPNLSYAVQDAQKVYNLLTDPRYGGVPKENALLLLNEQATRNAMVAAFRKMKAWEGYIYLYYSGHGAPKTVGKNLTDGYLVPADAEISDPEMLEDTSVKISYLQELIASSNARGILVALDACFSGGGKSIVPKGGKPLVGMLVSSEMMTPRGEGRIFLTSSAMNQQSWEDESEIGGGIFSHYLLEGLKGKAGGDVWIKADELANYVAMNVPQAARRLKGQDQQPQIRGKADFAVARNWERAKVSDAEIARGILKSAFEKGQIDSGQLGRALDELRTKKRTKTLEAFLEGKIDEKRFGELY